MERKIRILITKKLNPVLLKKFKPEKFQVQTSSFIRISLLNHVLPNEIYPLIVTSRNAVKAVEKFHPGYFKNKKVFCVGEKTARSLKQFDAHVVLTADHAEALVEKLLNLPVKEKYLFLSGNLRGNYLPEVLAAHKLLKKEILVYETLPKTLSLKTNYDAILFFSPSGVKSFSKKNNFDQAVCFAIGPTTASELQKHPLKVVTAASPSAENVVNLCLEYFDK